MTGSDEGGRAGTEREGPEIARWLTRYVAQWLECDEDSVDVNAPFERFGMDSSAAVGMAGDLEEWLGFEVEPIAPYEYPTIDALATHLADESKKRASRDARAAP